MPSSATRIARRWPVSRPRSGSPCSSRPGKGREVAIVAFARKAEVEPEALHFGLLRAGEREAAVGRMGGVVDVEGLAGAVARGHALDREGEHARDVGGA